jgi:hypothetical protein
MVAVRKLNVVVYAVGSMTAILMGACGTEAPTTGRAAPEWTGPVRSDAAAQTMMAWNGCAANSSFLDAHDAATPYVDIEWVAVDRSAPTHWRLRFAASLPKADTFDSAHTIFSYGLTFETTGDGVADYLVGISNEAPHPGHLRVWLTDLATGHTDEQVGPPYGFPVEFAHPGEVTEPADEDDEDGGNAMIFTFLPGTRPEGISRHASFYSWAFVEQDGEVRGWDYVPDVGWLTPAVEAERWRPGPEGVSEC